MPSLNTPSLPHTHTNPFLISILVLEKGCYFKIEIYLVIRKEIIVETLSSIQIGKSTHAPCVKGAAAQSLGFFSPSPPLFTWGSALPIYLITVGPISPCHCTHFVSLLALITSVIISVMSHLFVSYFFQ